MVVRLPCRSHDGKIHDCSNIAENLGTEVTVQKWKGIRGAASHCTERAPIDRHIFPAKSPAFEKFPAMTMGSDRIEPMARLHVTKINMISYSFSKVADGTLRLYQGRLGCCGL